MGIHHLNCGTLRPPSARLVNGHGSLLAPATMICRCLLVPVGDSWTLVDTGLGTADLADPLGRLSAPFLRLTHPELNPRETAIAQVRALGIDPEAVTDIVLTHLDVDHVGGIGDFPWARVHLAAPHLALIVPALDRRLTGRLHPVQWSHGPRWVPAALAEEYAGRPAARVNDRVRLVALDGHLTGHCGVVVERPGEPDLIHAGDAIFTVRTLDARPAPIGLAFFERRMRTDRAAWSASRTWLQQRHADGAEIICAHEPSLGPTVRAAGPAAARRSRSR